MLACKNLGLDGVAYFSNQVEYQDFAWSAINVALFAAEERFGSTYSDMCKHIKVGDAFNYFMFQQLGRTDRVKAVKLYILYDCSFSSVKHELGYPENRKTLRAQHQEFNKDGDLHERYTRAQKFTQEQRTEAEEHYYQHGRCISRTIQALGYPGRALLKQWLSEDHPENFQHCSADKPRVYLTKEQKVNAVHDLCTGTVSARSVADKYGVSPCSLYIWKKQFFSEGIPTQMPKDNKQNEQLGQF